MHLLYPRVTEEEIGPHASTDLDVWLFFQILGGHIALPILVATFLFAKTVSCHPAVVAACIAWILASVFSLLLYYVGQHTGTEPEQALCIAQASLLGAVPILICSALLVLAFQVWRSYDGRDVPVMPESRRRRLANYAIFAVPYVVFGLFVAAAVNLALNHTTRVNREQRYFYCSLDWSPFSTAVSVISMLMCLAAVALEVHVTISAHRYWRLLRSGDHLTDETLSLIIRTCIFTLYLLASSIVNLASTWVPLGVFPDMLSASVGLAMAFIFVTRWDILRAWSFWRRPSHADNSKAATDSTTFTAAPKRRYRPYRSTDSSTFGDVPSLSPSYTVDSALDLQTGKTTQMAQYESKGLGQGVQIIRRPEEAFKNVRVQPNKPRTTISTFGF